MKKKIRKFHLLKKAVIILQHNGQQKIHGGTGPAPQTRPSDTCLCVTWSCGCDTNITCVTCDTITQ